MIRNGHTATTLGGRCGSVTGTQDGAFLVCFQSFETYAKRTQLMLRAPGSGSPSACLTETANNSHFVVKEIATATPPQEYALPLAAGFYNGGGGNSLYWKDQFGQVHVVIAASNTASVPTNGFTIATLPQGFRPACTIIHSCGALDGSTRKGGLSFNVTSNGKIVCFGAVNIGSVIFGSVVFCAAS